MPEILFAGPEGRLEGRYHPQREKDSPIALILHPHPQFGGTMNNRVVYNLHYCFHKMGFNVMRFNFRGVGRSQGEFDQGVGEFVRCCCCFRLPPSTQSKYKTLLGCRIFFWSLDWDAVIDASSRDFWLHISIPSSKYV